MQETKELTELRLADLKSLKNRLERENLLLTKQNQEMAQELESSRAYIDKLLATRDDEAQWNAREEDYKRTISVLKKQIRTGDSTVFINKRLGRLVNTR
jgi:anthranilate/para-aminobenzoate synthase component I